MSAPENAEREPSRRTERGFGIYAEGVDRNGEHFSVQESSLATERCLWVGQDTAGCTPARAHLTEEQARQVRDGITAWLGEGQTSRDVEPDEQDVTGSRWAVGPFEVHATGYAGGLVGINGHYVLPETALRLAEVLPAAARRAQGGAS